MDGTQTDQKQQCEEKDRIMRILMNVGNDTLLSVGLPLITAVIHTESHSLCFLVQLQFLYDTSSSPCVIIIISVPHHTALYHFSFTLL